MQMILTSQRWIFARLLTFTTSWLSFVTSAWLFIFTIEWKYFGFMVAWIIITAMCANWPSEDK